MYLSKLFFLTWIMNKAYQSTDMSLPNTKITFFYDGKYGPSMPCVYFKTKEQIMPGTGLTWDYSIVVETNSEHISLY